MDSNNNSNINGIITNINPELYDTYKNSYVVESVLNIPSQLKKVKLVKFNYAEVANHNVISLTFDDFILEAKHKESTDSNVLIGRTFMLKFLENDSEEFSISMFFIRDVLTSSHENTLHIFFDDRVFSDEPEMEEDDEDRD